MKETHIIDTHLITDLRQIIEQGRRQAYISINASMIQTYWNVGRRIVEEEQHGEVRAGYGEYIAKNVAKNLQAEYGNAFNYRNICYFRKFYLCFKDIEIVNARVHNLTWTHIRHLLRVDDEKARLWYMKEAFSQLWSTRELERNINSQYYYRLLANNSWYFRNALVRANYRNPSRNIEPDKSFLTLFFRNLMLGEQNELKNRYMLIGYVGDTPTSTPTSTEQVQVGGNQFITEKENIKRLIIVVGEQKMSVKEMMEATGLKDRKADGFSLDDKRSEIKDNDISDIVNRFHNPKGEESRSRKEQSFFVPVEEIRNNNYDLSTNKYKEIEREKVEYEPVSDILTRLDTKESEYLKVNNELYNILEKA